MSEQERRELNRRVAVEVMGLQVHEVTPEQYSVYISDERDYVYAGGLYYVADGKAHELPDYLTGDGMLAVIERMRELGWMGDLFSVSGGWQCEFWHKGKGTVRERRDTAPEAIALAALAALGKGV